MLAGCSRVKVMGILNVTPDSFYDGGRFFEPSLAIRRAEEMVEEGVDVIDVGGVSTRPGSVAPGEEEEVRRVLPVIERLVERVKVPLSIDTFRSSVASACFKKGVKILNDVTALRGDENMAEVARDYGVEVILMHMKGTPKDMQENPYYEDVIKEIMDFFEERIDYAVKKGIPEEKIWIDPGIGFGKTLEHNLLILKNLKKLKSLGRPVLIGPSRKSFIGMILNLPPEERLYGTLATVAHAFWEGVDMVRVHDVRPAREVLEVLERIHSV